jgi:hypothetical protein
MMPEFNEKAKQYRRPTWTIYDKTAGKKLALLKIVGEMSEKTGVPACIAEIHLELKTRKFRIGRRTLERYLAELALAGLLIMYVPYGALPRYVVNGSTVAVRLPDWFGKLDGYIDEVTRSKISWQHFLDNQKILDY